ncbi:hypothetical protein [Burkholderia ubonensis]|uniref:hypothetical protein n=1 Tax=Burkholderia ubonensis TaxID=101571 RepID=UPI0012F8EA6A|nr:hypothetical protein [Burkholderia ubonensis]
MKRSMNATRVGFFRLLSNADGGTTHADRDRHGNDMQTSRKNVRPMFYVTFILIVIAYLTYLAGAKILLFVIGNKSLVAAAAAAALLVGMAHFLVKMKIRLKSKLLIIISLPIIAYTCVNLFDFLLPIQYGRCDFYTQKLHGGVRRINGQKYTINLCGTGGDSMQSGDEIRLQVFSENGRLLAQRHFTVNWNETFPNALEYSTDHITYYDNNGKGMESTISIPPTATDWLRARLPFLN